MTKTFDDYMNDPRIKNEPSALRITHAMRFKVQEDIQGMTPAERITYFNGSAARLLGKETAARLMVTV
jgi:hypothetical protein